MDSMHAYESPAKRLYDSSVIMAMRPARSRSASLSSVGSLYDSSSSSSSSLSSLESYEIQEIFKRIENITITDKASGPPPQASAVQLELPFRPAAQRNQRRLTLSSEGKLDPKAAPFIPGPLSSYKAQGIGCNAGMSLGPPPGLLTPSGSTAWQHIDSPDASPAESFDAYYDPAPPPAIHWWYYLEAGTAHDATADDLIRESNAVAAVTSNEHWSDEEMFFFASHFPGKVYSSVRSQEYPVAPFALSVYQAFESQKDVLTAQRFLMALRQHSMNAFMNSWSKESFNPELHVHLESGLSGHVFASLYLAKFIGDLFNVGLLSKDHVKTCIAKLFEGPHSEEHIVALGHLVVQAGPEFWMSEPMVLDAKEFEDFMQRFENAATYARGSLIEYNEQPSGYSARWVEFVREHFLSWEASMAEYSC